MGEAGVSDFLFLDLLSERVDLGLIGDFGLEECTLLREDGVRDLGDF